MAAEQPRRVIDQLVIAQARELNLNADLALFALAITGNRGHLAAGFVCHERSHPVEKDRLTITYRQRAARYCMERNPAERLYTG